MSDELPPIEIRQVEASLTLAGIELPEFLKAAGVDQSTWWRWRANITKKPHAHTWKSVTATLDRMGVRLVEQSPGEAA